MKETTTSGERKTFRYEGSLQKGFKLYFERSSTEIPARMFFAILENFSGQSVIGGFDRDNPPAEGIGYFIQQYSSTKLQDNILPLNGTHIIAILRDENFVNVRIEGSKVIVDF